MPTMKAASASALSAPPMRRISNAPARVAGEPDQQRAVQQRQRKVEARVVGHRHVQHGREDDRRVAEHHREDEADQQRVQRRVVAARAGCRPPAASATAPPTREPHVAREQRDRDEARQPLAAHGAPGDVLAHQPDRQRRAARREQRRRPRACRACRRRARRRRPRAARRTRARATGDGGRKRDSSSRSPAIVSTRKAIHHGTTSCTAKPSAQRALPASQANAPSASVKVNSARWRRRMSIDAAVSTTPPAT